MIKRKTPLIDKEPKARVVRTKKIKVDLSALPDAIVEGKLIVPLNGRLVFERSLNGRTAVHEGTVFSIDDDGALTIYDETRAQFYVININQPHPPVKTIASKSS